MLFEMKSVFLSVIIGESKLEVGKAGKEEVKESKDCDEPHRAFVVRIPCVLDNICLELKVSPAS